MKIAFYLDNLKMGGVQRRTLRIIKGLLQVDGRLKIDMLLDDNTGELLSFIDKKINVIDIKKQPKSLAVYVKETNPDIIIACKGRQAVNLIIAKYIYKFDTKTAIIQAVTINLVDAPFFKNFLRKRIVRLVFPKLDKIITVSNGVKKEVESVVQLPAKKTEVIYNPVVEENLNEKMNENVSHPFFEGNNKIVLGIGRLHPQKDFTTLVKAFYLAYKKQPSLKLIIIGEGNLREKLQKEIDNLGLTQCVDLVGTVENPYPYLNKADVFAFSSIYEGFGNVLVESMAVGTPIVSTNCKSGPDEILEDGKWGVLVPVRDEISLSEGIINQLKNPTKSSALIKRAQDFTLEKVARKYIRLFSEIIVS